MLGLLILSGAVTAFSYTPGRLSMVNVRVAGFLRYEPPSALR